MSAWDSIRSGMNSIPIVGGITQGIFGDPAQEAHQANLQKAGRQIADYRTTANQGRMNAFQNSALAFNPLNSLMSQMYGEQAVPNMQGMVQNPLEQQMNAIKDQNSREGEANRAAFDARHAAMSQMSNKQGAQRGTKNFANRTMRNPFSLFG